MANVSERFLADVARRGHEPLLANVVGSVRIDVRDGQRFTGKTVHIDHGDLRLSDAKQADCRVIASREVFDQLVTGQSNALAAMIRGAVAVEGDYELLVLFQRLLPGRQPEGDSEVAS